MISQSNLNSWGLYNYRVDKNFNGLNDNLEDKLSALLEEYPKEHEKLLSSQDILNGFRGYSVDKPTIIKTLCAIQKLAPLVKEVDINPLISNTNGSFAVDARIIL